MAKGNGSARAPLRSAVDVAVVGAGFAGIYALYKMRKLGLSVQGFETGSDVGGTWYWNRYPGARCDVVSFDYQFSFSDEIQRGWIWTELYPAQEEILRYAAYVADKLNVRKHILFQTRVLAAVYDNVTATWRVTTDAGDEVTAKYCIMATGCLASAPRDPEIEGKDKFQGQIHFTSNWPKDGVDLKGKRVAVIGTGSSGVQAIPEIAKVASHLYVFQRTPNFSMPARNRPLGADEVAHTHDHLPERRAVLWSTRSGNSTNEATNKAAFDDTPEQQEAELRQRIEKGGFEPLFAYKDMFLNTDANEVVASFIRRHIQSIVKDAKVAEMLSPRDHPVGTKRPCLDTNYYETYNRPNVTLVDIRKTPIKRFTPTGIVADKEYAVDAVVFATGFDAMTGPLFRIDIRGKGGLPLREKWAAGPRTYLGLMVNGFPNLFTITGPGSPSVLSNMMMSIEQHVEWIADCIAELRAQGVVAMEANKDAEDAWVAHVNDYAGKTLYHLANSWYLGANVPGKPRVFMPYVGGISLYRDKCNEVAQAGYAGFDLRRG